MKIIVVLVAVVMATICWTGVTAQADNDTVDAEDFQNRYGNLSSDSIWRMVEEIQSAGDNGSSEVRFDEETRRFFPSRIFRCEDGPFSVLYQEQNVFYWPPVSVKRCFGGCPNRSPCIARKQVTRNVLTVQYKKFNVWGKYIWIATSVRKICVRDDTCCECKQCSDITNFFECIKTSPCPDTTNPNTFCYWKPYRSWVNSTSVSPSIWGSCACCKKTLCEPGQFFDRRRCQCRCIPKRCPGPLVQDPDTCKCVCPHKDIDCGRKRIIDSCSCQCKCKPFFCIWPRIPNSKTCHCDCPKTTCKRPFKLNQATCQCVCPWNIKCRSGYYLNQRDCRCYLRGYGRY